MLLRGDAGIDWSLGDRIPTAIHRTPISIVRHSATTQSEEPVRFRSHSDFGRNCVTRYSLFEAKLESGEAGWKKKEFYHVFL